MKLVMLLSTLIFFGCASKSIREVKSPSYFHAKFKTTKGDFTVQFDRELSPLAVDRVYQLIASGYYTDIAIFRVIPNFVAQFGIHTDTAMNRQWKDGVPDEKPIGKNTEGTIAFARGGKMTRNTQLFINLRSNSPRLDTLKAGGVEGYPVVGKVIGDGMDIVNQFYSGYSRNVPNQGKIRAEGNAYLRREYPKLDYIISVELVR